MSICCKKTAGFIRNYNSLKKRESIVVDCMIKNMINKYDYDIGFFKTSSIIRNIKLNRDKKRYLIKYRIISARRELILMEIKCHKRYFHNIFI